jgi:hypothetical protein
MNDQGINREIGGRLNSVSEQLRWFAGLMFFAAMIFYDQWYIFATFGVIAGIECWWREKRRLKREKEKTNPTT